MNTETGWQWKDTGGGDFEQPEPGTYAAICYRIIDLGTQYGEYQGVPNEKEQTLISFELNELMTTGDSAGKPFVVSKFYTTSLGKKANLRRDLESWRGRAFTDEELAGFDPKNILGKSCMLSLTMTDKGKIKISTISKLPKGMNAPAPVNPQVFFTLRTVRLDPVFETLSDGIKKIIMRSPEYGHLISKPKSSPPQGGTFDQMHDYDIDIPF